MGRKITDEFLKWKNEDQGRTALLVEGARRVGKSYLDQRLYQLLVQRICILSKGVDLLTSKL